jgi:phosphoglycerate dehydrogenase-like enzyme
VPTETRVAADVSYRDLLDPLPAGVLIDWFESYDEILAVVPDAEVLLLGPDRGWEMAPVLAAAPRLRWTHTRAAGVDRGQLQPMSTFRERGITVTNGSGISSVPIAEYVAMAVLAVAKGLPALLAQQAQRAWVKPTGTREVLGSKALLLGFGDVGRAVAQRLEPFGIDVTAVRRRPGATGAADGATEVIGPDDWRPRLAEFDWVVLTAPLTPETRHLVGAPELAAMRPDAWLVNVSRGGVVDQAALTAALSGAGAGEGIGGAVLDVTEPEPLPADHALWGLPNAIVTPHCSWVSPSFGARAAELFVENLRRWCTGAPLHNVVDLEAGY